MIVNSKLLRKGYARRNFLESWLNNIDSVRQSSIVATKHSSFLFRPFSTETSIGTSFIERIKDVNKHKLENRWQYLQVLDLELYHHYKTFSSSEAFHILTEFAKYTNYHLLRNPTINMLLNTIDSNIGDKDSSHESKQRHIAPKLSADLMKLRYQLYDRIDELNKKLTHKEARDYSNTEMYKVISFWAYYSGSHTLNASTLAFLKRISQSEKNSFAKESNNVTLETINMKIDLYIIAIFHNINPEELDTSAEICVKLVARSLRGPPSLCVIAIAVIRRIRELELLEHQAFRTLVSRLLLVIQDYLISQLLEGNIFKTSFQTRRLIEKLTDELFSRGQIQRVLSSLNIQFDGFSHASFVYLLSKIKKYRLFEQLYEEPQLLLKFEALRDTLIADNPVSQDAIKFLDDLDVLNRKDTNVNV